MVHSLAEVHFRACKCRTSDVNYTRIIDGLSMDMAKRHMTHEEHKAKPWHVVVLDVLGDEICPSRAYEQRSNARIECEQSDEVEQRYTKLTLVATFLRILSQSSPT